jgi:hypothetical protein
MGSKPQARLGARAACKAVREAVTKWAQVDGAPTSYLAHLVEVFWRLRIFPCQPKDAAATCLLAVAKQNGDWVVDLVPDKIDGFCNWIVEDFQNLDPAVRWRRIAAELRGWPTHKHLDDKTIAVLKISAEASEEMV